MQTPFELIMLKYDRRKSYLNMASQVVMFPPKPFFNVLVSTQYIFEIRYSLLIFKFSKYGSENKSNKLITVTVSPK